MNKEKKIRENGKSIGKIRILPESNVLSAVLLVFGFAEVLFLMLVIALDVLPLKYVLAIVGIIVLIDVFVVFLMNTKSKHGTRRIAALVLVFLVLNTLTIGDYYVYSTYNTLQKISKEEATWEYYYVIGLKGGSYNTVDDIQGQTIYSLDMDSKQLKEAEERIVTKADVNYEREADFVTVGRHLVAEDGQTQDNLILLSATNYKLLKENVKNIKGKTKVIYKIKVMRRANDSAKRVDVTKDSFVVLISGIDVWGGIHKEGLSDVNMLMVVNPAAKQILLVSIPRDSYVQLHSYGGKDKLTHTGIYGVDETKKTIEDFLDVDINYTVRVNFAALVDLVNAVDGIDVYSDYEFKSSISHWTYTKGWNYLTGHSALYFARERKSFVDGDMQRNKQQQIVLEALIKKISNSKVLLTRYTKILNAVGDNMRTDMTNRDLKKLVKMQAKDMSSWEIKKANIVGSTGGAPSYCMGNRELSVVFPSDESVNNAKEMIHDVMYPVQNTEKSEKSTTQNKGE